MTTTTFSNSGATTPEDALRELREYVQVEASRVAVEALVEVARDPKATAQARATAGSAILRAAGFFKEGDDGSKRKEPWEMSAEEIKAEIRRGSDRLRRLGKEDIFA